jgi:predicted alpha/beta-fold hydrolase
LLLLLDLPVATKMEWLGRAKTRFTTAPSPIRIVSKDGTSTNLLAVSKATTPPCQLNPLLFNGHLQTMWTAAKQHGPSVYYRRRVFTADHPSYPGTFAVDFVDEPFAERDASLPPRTAYMSDAEFEGIASDDARPQLVVLHGLSGGSHEIYLRHAIAPLVESGDWEVCVVNSRGCANSTLTTGLLYNARATWDVRQVGVL